MRLRPKGTTFTAGNRVVLGDNFLVNPSALFTAGTDAAVGTLGQTFTYGYQDVQYFLESADAVGYWGTLAWTYDRIGNRLTEDRDGTVDAYTYQLNATGNTPTLQQLSLGVGGTRDYAFDTAGNLDLVTAGANVIDFVPDDESRQASLVRGVESASFTYDGRSFLSRVERAAGTEFTEPTYSSEGLLHSLTRQGLAPAPLETVNYFYFAGRPVAQLKDDGTTSTWTFLTTDHLGTSLLATDLSKNEIWRGPFEPFGRDVNQAAPNSARGQGIFLGFPGQWDDGRWQNASQGADLYYNVHRWYEFGTGRYGRVDPLGAALGDPHAFTYAKAIPSRFTDPLGLRAVAFLGCEAWFYDDDWNLIRKCSAGSGVTGSGIGDQGLPYAGPIPEGLYTLNPREFSGGWLRDLVRGPGWGRWRVPLHPNEGTIIPPGRDPNTFFFHGDDRSDRPDTLGCVDIGDCDSWARNWAMEDPDNPVLFIVRYVQGKICN